MFFDALSNAACRVSLCDPGAEVEERVLKHTRPGVVVAEHRPGAGVCVISLPL